MLQCLVSSQHFQADGHCTSCGAGAVLDVGECWMTISTRPTLLSQRALMGRHASPPKAQIQNRYCLQHFLPFSGFLQSSVQGSFVRDRQYSSYNYGGEGHQYATDSHERTLEKGMCYINFTT